MEALPGILAWARARFTVVDAATAARIDWSNIVVGGHSRGAEVAARSAARFPALPRGTGVQPEAERGDGGCVEGRICIRAVLLVDPVAKQPSRTPLVSTTQPYYAIGVPPRPLASLHSPPPHPAAVINKPMVSGSFTEASTTKL